MTTAPGERVTPAQRAALAAMAPALEPGSYLAGGVAIAARLAHRASLDLDVFVPGAFAVERLVERLSAAVPELRVTGRGDEILHAEVGEVPISVLGYHYPLLGPAVRLPDWPLPLATLEDLACMKLAAIAGRSAAKDFWDLRALLGAGVAGGSLSGALALHQKKFAGIDLGHVVRSLVYFGDADATPLPQGLSASEWLTIKGWYRDAVREVG